MSINNKFHVYENIPSGYALIRELDCNDPMTYESHDMATWVSEYETKAEAEAHAAKFYA